METMSSAIIAVAVNGGHGVKGKGSRRAVRWAVENLLPKARRFILVHVMPSITSVPTPSGGRIPVEELDKSVVALYVQEVKVKVEEEIIFPFKKLCKASKVETLVLEGDDAAAALLRYASESGITSFALGSWSPNCIVRKLKGPGVPTTMVKSAPETCDIFVVYKHKIIKKSASNSSTCEIYSRRWIFGLRDNNYGFISTARQVSESCSSSIEPRVQKTIEKSADYSLLDSEVFKHAFASSEGSGVEKWAEDNLGDKFHTSTSERSISTASVKSDESNVQAEVEKLRLELRDTIKMYNQACEELVHAQNKVQLLSSEYLEEARRVNAAQEREETLRKMAAEEKAKYLEAMKKVEEAKNLLDKEAHQRQIAELNSLKESLEKQILVDALITSDRRYRRYTMDEIEAATDFFSTSNVIGEGGYGKVYKCNIDHTPVAIKVLDPNAKRKKEEFLREVEVLSQLHHPHLVLLLGACPEGGCLVYEYLENGSLEDCIFHQSGKPPLPWFVRFRIIFEVACGLAFLHNSKPEAIVHRDLKPGNILLDRNYVSKIGDVGLAKLISDIVPDNITEYRDSMVAGTFYYMDPEYQRTGTVRPKSDLYAFGIIVLQVLTARRPNGLLLTVENAITHSSFADILDKSVTDWPLAETEELAQIALRCSKLRCRDRPDLDVEVLPSLKRLVDIAAASVKVERGNIYAPNHYFCPILQDIMGDPYIAADGFSYEHRAIKAWLEKHSVSPVTKLKLQHSIIVPDHTLRSAIQEWSSRVKFKIP